MTGRDDTAAGFFAALSALVLLCLSPAGCGSDPPPPAVAPAPPSSAAPAPAAAPPAAEEKDEELPETSQDDEPAEPAAASPAEPQPPSTASFEQATSTPEPIVPNDDRIHLTDNQLSGPMRGVLLKCKVPPRAKVTIKTAVQFGRAIGVTVIVELPKLKQPKKPTKESKKAAKAQLKAAAKIRECADHAVRALSWPPSRRRDAFTTTF